MGGARLTRRLTLMNPPSGRFAGSELAGQETADPSVAAGSFGFISSQRDSLYHDPGRGLSGLWNSFPPVQHRTLRGTIKSRHLSKVNNARLHHHPATNFMVSIYP